MPGQGCGSLGEYEAADVVNNGKRMIDFCIGNEMLIGNSFFPHKRISQITFTSVGRGQNSTIDYVVYQKKTRYAIYDVRAYRSAELSMEDGLLVMKGHFRSPKKEKDKKYSRIKIEEFRKEKKDSRKCQNS